MRLWMRRKTFKGQSKITDFFPELKTLQDTKPPRPMPERVPMEQTTMFK